MDLYQRHPIYAFTHVLMGFVGAWYPVILVLALLYQLVQYIFDFRFFLFELKARRGNSFNHTLLKLMEVLVGNLFGVIIKNIIKTVK